MSAVAAVDEEEEEEEEEEETKERQERTKEKKQQQQQQQKSEQYNQKVTHTHTQYKNTHCDPLVSFSIRRRKFASNGRKPGRSSRSRILSRRRERPLRVEQMICCRK